MPGLLLYEPTAGNPVEADREDVVGHDRTRRVEVSIFIGDAGISLSWRTRRGHSIPFHTSAGPDVVTCYWPPGADALVMAGTGSVLLA